MESRREIEKRVNWKRISRYTDISKAYYKKLIKSGDELELFEYNQVRITFKNKRKLYIKNTGDKKREDSLKRSRQAIYRIVKSNCGKHGDNLPIFITLTFKENVTDLRSANFEFKLFIQKLNYNLGIKLKYLCVPEFQKRGAVHYHLVAFNLPFVDLEQFQSLWGHGYTRVETTKKIDNIAAYISKYLSKNTLDKRMYGEKTYFTSRGLIRPKTSFYSVAIDNYLSSVNIKLIQRSSRGDYEFSKYKICK